MIIAGLATGKSLVTRILSNKKLILLGNASYSVYILQWPVFIIFTNLVNKESLDGIYFYFYLISLIIISIIVYLFFEKNMKKIILKKLIKK